MAELIRAQAALQHRKKHAGFRAGFPGERRYNPDSELGSQCLASCLLTR